MPKIDPETEAVAEQLRTVLGYDEHALSPHALEVWAREPLRSRQPAVIRTPDEHDGNELISISCTQTNLPAKQQRRLVEQWCEYLPAQPHVRYLWFHSRVPQELFDAACRLPHLEALYIKWSGIKRLDALESCHQLRQLKLGTSASVESIDPIGKMTSLQWLQIDNVRAATSLAPLSELTGLSGLGVTGAEFKNYTVESFSPLASLTQLEWLHLGSVHTLDGSLEPLTGLRNLRWLGLGNFFSVEQFAMLSVRLPPGVCEWAQPFARSHPSVFPCRKCKKNCRVMTSGTRSQLLCPSCDSLKLARHVVAFNAAKAAAGASGSHQ